MIEKTNLTNTIKEINQTENDNNSDNHSKKKTVNFTKVIIVLLIVGLIQSWWQQNNLQKEIEIIKRNQTDNQKTRLDNSNSDVEQKLPTDAQKINLLSPTPTPNLVIVDNTTKDMGNQTSNDTKLKVVIPGGVFINQCLSGEEGSFAQDGKLDITWGASYEPDADHTKNQAQANWQISHGQLVIAGTQISDGTYTDFSFFDYQGDLIIDTRANKSGCGLIIGASKAAIDDYLKK